LHSCISVNIRVQNSPTLRSYRVAQRAKILSTAQGLKARYRDWASHKDFGTRRPQDVNCQRARSMTQALWCRAEVTRPRRATPQLLLATYTVWRDALTAGATSLTNDPTPGAVDEIDFTCWRAHFGLRRAQSSRESLGSGAGAAQAAVPEPSTLALFLLGSIASAVCWRSNFLVICGSTGYNPIRPPCWTGIPGGRHAFP